MGLQRLYRNSTHVGAHTLTHTIDQLVNHRPMRIASGHQHFGYCVRWPPGSLVSSWGLSLTQKDSIMYSPHTVALPPAPLWIDTWQAYPQMGQTRGRGRTHVYMCVCMCCRGEGAQAEVTDWNNGADERQESCLGFEEGDYWVSRSPVLSNWLTQRWGGWRGQRVGGGAQRARSLQTADTKPASCTSEQPTVQKCVQHNAKQIHFVCVLCVSVCICIGL